MRELNLVKVKSQIELEKFYPVIKELRTKLTYSDFLNLYEKAHENNGYEIIGVEDHGKIVAAMGYRILYDFVHGKHLYIDDLVSTEAQRSKGFGALLLKHAEILANEHNCNGLRLCTGIENEKGKKFYERNGWNFRAIVYKKKLEP